MKIVYFKIKGQKYCRSGPALDSDTSESVIERLSRVFNVSTTDIEILELT